MGVSRKFIEAKSMLSRGDLFRRRGLACDEILSDLTCWTLWKGDPFGDISLHYGSTRGTMDCSKCICIH